MTRKLPDGTWGRQYPKRRTSHGRRDIHRMRAEAALGKPLPKRAVVHHPTDDWSPTGPLVICQDQGYHMLLHRRERVRAAGGDPNADAWCSLCKRPRPQALFAVRRSGKQAGHFAGACRDCMRAQMRERRRLGLT